MLGPLWNMKLQFHIFSHILDSVPYIFYVILIVEGYLRVAQILGSLVHSTSVKIYTIIYGWIRRVKSKNVHTICKPRIESKPAVLQDKAFKNRKYETKQSYDQMLFFSSESFG